MVKILLGADQGLLLDEAKEAIKKELGTVSEFNYETFDLYNDLIQDVVDSATSMGFVTDRKCILVRNCYFFSSDMNKPPRAWEAKQDYNSFAHYLEHPNPDCDIFMIGQGKLTGVQTNEAVKAIKKYCDIINEDALRPEELAQRGLRYVGERHADISHDALIELVSRCPGGWLMLRNSLDKLLTYTDTISLETVQLLVAPRIEDSVFSVISCLFHNDIRSAVSSYRDLRTSGNDALSLLPVFTSQLRFFYLVSYQLEQRKNDLDISRNLGLSSTGRVWHARKDIGSLSSSTILTMMADLGKIEDNVKFRLDDPDVALELFMTNFRRRYFRIRSA